MKDKCLSPLIQKGARRNPSLKASSLLHSCKLEHCFQAAVVHQDVKVLINEITRFSLSLVYLNNSAMLLQSPF